MGVELLTSRLLAGVPNVVHGFSTRKGGISAGPLSSLNLGATVGDERTSVNQNREAVLLALGRSEAQWVSLKQIHGEVVVEVTRQASRTIEADCLWTRDGGAAIAVLVADCVPILIAEASGKAVAAVHAGWRGTKAKIAARAVERLKDAGYKPDQLIVAIGPAIGPCCFTIGADVAGELRQAYGEGVEHVRADNGRLCADLWGLNSDSLTAVGVPAKNIEAMRLCVSCQHEQFFSHRRDQGTTGRQCGVIGLRNAR